MESSWKRSDSTSLDDPALSTRPILKRGPSVYQGAEEKVIAEVRAYVSGRTVGKEESHSAERHKPFTWLLVWLCNTICFKKGSRTLAFAHGTTKSEKEPRNCTRFFVNTVQLTQPTPRPPPPPPRQYRLLSCRMAQVSERIVSRALFLLHLPSQATRVSLQEQSKRRWSILARLGGVAAAMPRSSSQSNYLGDGESNLLLRAPSWY